MHFNDAKKLKIPNFAAAKHIEIARFLEVPKSKYIQCYQSGIYPEKGICFMSPIYCSRAKYGKIKKFIHRKIPCVVPRSFAGFVLHIRELSFNPLVRNASMNNLAEFRLKWFYLKRATIISSLAFAAATPPF